MKNAAQSSDKEAQQAAEQSMRSAMQVLAQSGICPQGKKSNGVVRLTNDKQIELAKPAAVPKPHPERFRPEWQNNLFDGLVVETGRPAKIASGNITKPITSSQLPEHFIPSLEVISNNNLNRGLQRTSKQKISIHRAMSFLPQE